MEALYQIDSARKMEFAGIYLLEYMINQPRQFAVLLQDEEEDLEPILEWLLVKDYVSIKDNADYIASSKGQEALKRFMARYSEFLNVFDIYCAVDLGAGEFAFASYFEYEDRSSWRAFLNEERWEDMRIAVAEFKGIDAVEIVFMSFLNENRFGRDQIGWQFDLLLGSVWDEILEICNTAIRIEQLSYETQDGFVSGENVMKDILKQGTNLLIELKKNEAQRCPPIHHDGEASLQSADMVDPVELPEYEVDHYEKYYDPYYRPAHWRDRWYL